MHFTTIATVATMAAVVAAEAQPYRLAVMPGLSLMRRSTNGYVPETTKCGAGNSCAEACGAGFAQCPSHDNISHCYNPQAQQNCCQDGSGNSCDNGYYCTHDTKQETWCCPNDMDLAACAAAYKVVGGLESATPTHTSTPTPSSTSTSTSTWTSAVNTTTPISTEPVVTETLNITTTVPCASSSGHTTVWTGNNSTISVPTAPATVPVPPSTHTGPAVVPTGHSAAAATSFSALLLVAAGAIALL